MSQNSLILPTTGTVSGLQMTQNTNAALDTLNTLASGAAAPASPEAGQCWHDTTNNIVKMLSQDSSTWIPLFVLNESAYTAKPYTEGAFGQCQFQYTSTTACTIVPYKGNKVSFPNGTVATIPSGGISTNPTSCFFNGTGSTALTPATLYYAYLWNNAGTYVIDWSTTAYSTDTTSGITIKTGDATRVLVGMAYIVSGPAFSNTGGTRYVRSYFNDPGIAISQPITGNPSTASTTATEVSTSIRANFLKWANDNVACLINGAASKNTSSGSFTSYINFDGTTAGQGTSGASSASGALVPVVCTDNATGIALSEGVHYATMFGLNNTAGTTTWTSGCALTLTARS